MLPTYQRVLFTPDGKTLVSRIKGKGLGQLWDVETKKEKATLQPPEGEGRVVLSLALSPDGKALAVFTFGKFDAATGAERMTLRKEDGPVVGGQAVVAAVSGVPLM